MARHGTPSTSESVDVAVSVVLAGMPAPIGNPHQITHCEQQDHKNQRCCRLNFEKKLGLPFGLAMLQQKTRSRSQEKVGSAFGLFTVVRDVGKQFGGRHS